MSVLGIDGGGSSSKWVILDALGQAIAQGQAGPITGHLFKEEQRQQIFATLDELLAQARPYRLDAVVGGITGLDAHTPEAAQLTAYIAGALELPTARVSIMNDMDLAYRANFAPGAGILVYAGTGSVAYHLTRQGQVVRAGGHGFIIGDEGGGYWIGKTALRQLMRWHDEGLSTDAYPLAQELYGAIGGSDWPTIRAYVYGGGRQAVAALAPAVGRAAQQGDPLARQILLQAGRELADLAQTLRHRVGVLPVVLTGGALRVSPLIEQGASESLPLSTSQISSAEAAARMALSLSEDTSNAR